MPRHRQSTREERENVIRKKKKEREPIEDLLKG